MAEAKEPPQDSAKSQADTMALIAEAEAEAAEAEALAAAARARARAARLRREALAQAKAAAEEAPGADEDATGTAAAKTDEDVTDTVEATDADEDVTASAEEKTAGEATDAKEAETEEEVSDEEAEDAEAESKSAPSRRRMWLPSLSVTWKAAVIVLICAFTGASGYMMWQRHETVERNQQAARIIAGARQGVVNMTSLDFNKAKEDVQRVIDSSTGQFRDDFQQRAKDFTTVVEQSKVVTQGTVNAAAVQSVNGDFALVLVAATSRITNAAGAKDEPRNWRLKVTVKNDGGQYKMSNVEFIP
jgi:Mce-associated membrane protein